ncbi:MAG TPA: helix-turn-helix transcriptional regulator [Polyangiaceae bacterium]|nr:helix-turn-helix transcriptional regulator [Polyangiaceae bacterium]
MTSALAALFERSRAALGTTQEELGARLGVSRRTAQRWAAGGIPSYSLADLARLVHPCDESLAREIAVAAGTSLEVLGLEPLAAPAAAKLPVEAIVDAVVCAAAEAMNLMPREARPGLLAAFARAKQIGLSVDEVEGALRASLAPTALPAASDDKRAKRRGADRPA